jgi:hypothetical protein
LAGWAQQPAYPQQYFRNPLHIPILLAGNFGECRPDHFHSGIDIKTNGRENLPVFAAADGYVSRIKMSPSGFGHALYITHPNGYTTLYAHLNNFLPAIQQFVRVRQYETENWEVDITLAPQQFPVKKGGQIAWSGNTGSSTAPHLHFEIRDTKTEAPLNPQLFGFKIPDTRPPVLKQLAVYDLNKSIYEQSPQLLPLQKEGDLYVPLQDTLRINTLLAGIGLYVDDYMNGSENLLAHYTAAWFLDDVLQGKITLDNISYDATRYLNAYADYKTQKQTGNWVQCLFRLPGNRLASIYQSLNGNRGGLALTDFLPHEVRVAVVDDAGNKSTLRFWLQAQEGGKSSAENCVHLFPAGKANTFAQPDISFTLKEQSLYDDICFVFAQEKNPTALSHRFSLHQPFVPLHQPFVLTLKPTISIPASLRKKMVIRYSNGKSKTGYAAQADEQGGYQASVRNFGDYWLEADTTAPVITPVAKTANYIRATQLRFRVTDDKTSVQSFHATLNGQWLLFEQHGDYFFYNFDDHCPKGKNRLQMRVADANGNIRNRQYDFIR